MHVGVHVHISFFVCWMIVYVQVLLYTNCIYACIPIQNSSIHAGACMDEFVGSCIIYTGSPSLGSHQFPWLFHDFPASSFAFSITYFYAIFKHTARILEGKGFEWLIILRPIIKEGPGMSVPDIFWKMYMRFGALYCRCCMEIINLVNFKVFIWKNVQLCEIIQLTIL